MSQAVGHGTKEMSAAYCIREILDLIEGLVRAEAAAGATASTSGPATVRTSVADPETPRARPSSTPTGSIRGTGSASARRLGRKRPAPVLPPGEETAGTSAAARVAAGAFSRAASGHGAYSAWPATVSTDVADSETPRPRPSSTPHATLAAASGYGAYSALGLPSCGSTPAPRPVSASVPPKERNPPFVYDKRFVVDVTRRMVECDECLQYFQGCGVGDFVARTRAVPVAERYSLWDAGLLDAHWYCVDCWAEYLCRPVEEMPELLGWGSGSNNWP